SDRAPLDGRRRDGAPPQLARVGFSPFLSCGPFSISKKKPRHRGECTGTHELCSTPTERGSIFSHPPSGCDEMSAGVGSWQDTVHALFEPRARHTATLLPSGLVFLHGGLSKATLSATGSSELYHPEINDTVETSRSSIPRYSHTATLLPDGSVLVVGGSDPDLPPPLDSSQLYNPSTETWSETNGHLHVGRMGHTATPLADGKVLVVGGQGGEDWRYLSSTEIYDPVTQAWAFVAELNEARTGHTATLLLDGRVLVVGGYGKGRVLDSTELYDPATGTWTSGETLFYRRCGHTATRLLDGKVLIAGG